MAALQRVGARFDFVTRLNVIGHDIIGLIADGVAPISYGLALAVGLLVALPTAGVVLCRLSLPRSIVFACAGATTVAAILFIIQINYFYHMTLLEGTRGPIGYGSQLIAGALGGATYAKCTATHHKS